MTKRKKWIPTRFTGLTYTGGIRPLPAPRRKRARSLSEPRESKEKAALALEHQGGGVETGLTAHISTSGLPKNEEDCKI